MGWCGRMSWVRVGRRCGGRLSWGVGGFGVDDDGRPDDVGEDEEEEDEDVKEGGDECCWSFSAGP